MENLFICCFRSCLKGKESEKNNKDYYIVLGLHDSNSTAEDIKKAFKRKSLEMHPDKLAQRGLKVTPEDSAKFQRMKDAYDCLSDPKRRRYYDEFGESGLKMVESTQDGNLFELLRNFQSNKLDCAFLTLLILTIFIFLLILPILFCLKSDGIIGLQWIFIWIPMWIVDTVLLASAGLFLVSGTDSKDPEDKSGGSPFLSKLYFFVRVVLFITAQIFVILELDGYITWSYMLVVTPWIIFEVLTIINSIPHAITVLVPPDYRDFVNLIEDPEEQKMMRIQVDTEYHEKVTKRIFNRRYIVVSSLRLMFAVLLALKLDDAEPYPWALVFLPIWIYFVYQFCWASNLVAMGTIMVQQLDQNTLLNNPLEMDPVQLSEAQRANALIAMGHTELCLLWIPVSLAVLAVCYLQLGGFSSFIIMIPIFIIIGCCMCATFCALGFLANVDVDIATDAFDKSKKSKDPNASESSSRQEHRQSSDSGSETDSLLRKNKSSGTDYINGRPVRDSLAGRLAQPETLKPAPNATANSYIGSRKNTTFNKTDID